MILLLLLNTKYQGDREDTESQKKKLIQQKWPCICSGWKWGGRARLWMTTLLTYWKRCSWCVTSPRQQGLTSRIWGLPSDCWFITSLTWNRGWAPCSPATRQGGAGFASIAHRFLPLKFGLVVSFLFPSCFKGSCGSPSLSVKSLSHGSVKAGLIVDCYFGAPRGWKR